ncbi:MAG: ribonuclease HI family protein [Elusimicrobia bacterium]|nr:ribonuclease HI family protein [Elusimicrobiota bacterium]
MASKDPDLGEILKFLAETQNFAKLYEKYPHLSKANVENRLKNLAARIASKTKISCFFDGAAQPNPGPAGAGAVIYRNGIRVKEISRFLGVKTNNQAEYLALNIALDEIMKLASGPCAISLFSDSQLLVKQINGLWRVKDKEIQKLLAEAKEKLARIAGSGKNIITISHIARQKNKVADSLSTLALKRKI